MKQITLTIDEQAVAERLAPRMGFAPGSVDACDLIQAVICGAIDCPEDVLDLKPYIAAYLGVCPVAGRIHPQPPEAPETPAVPEPIHPTTHGGPALVGLVENE